MPLRKLKSNCILLNVVIVYILSYQTQVFRHYLIFRQVSRQSNSCYYNHITYSCDHAVSKNSYRPATYLKTKWSFGVSESFVNIHDQFFDGGPLKCTYFVCLFLSFPVFLFLFFSFFNGRVCDDFNCNLKVQVFWTMTLCGLVSHVSEKV